MKNFILEEYLDNWRLSLDDLAAFFGCDVCSVGDGAIVNTGA